MEKNILPFSDLKKIASSLAQTQNAIGAIVIVFKNDSISIGASDVDHDQLLYALNMGIYHTINYKIENQMETEDAS